jgi:hypothetical protein
VPNSIAEVLKVLGFTPAYLYAAAAYGVFHFLDKKASGQAKRIVSLWLRALPYDKKALSDAILEAFTRIYGPKLLSWSTALRSMCISIAATIAYLFHFFGLKAYLVIITPPYSKLAVGALIGNIASDYLSLFLVRLWLRRAGKAPILVLLLGPIVGGLLIVTVSAISFYITSIYLVAEQFGWLPLFDPKLYLAGLESAYGGLFSLWTTEGSTQRVFFIPALIVHLWLPLFAFGVLGCQALNSFKWTTVKAQWFLKQGQHHPFDAIGLVAAAATFVITIAAQAISTLIF